jgi:uncharacterized protein YkwD
MSSDNWEGDRDLDSFKGQDWKGRVIDGKYDDRYKGVVNYGSRGRHRGRGTHHGGYGHRRRVSKNSKIILGIVFPIIAVGVLFYLENQTDFIKDLESKLTQDSNQKESTIVTTESSLFTVLDSSEKVTLSDCIMRSNTKNHVKINCNDAGIAEFYSDNPVKTTIANQATITQENGKYIVWFFTSDGQKQTFVLQKITSETNSDSDQFNFPKLELPQIKIPPIEIPKIEIPEVAPLLEPKPSTEEDAIRAIEYINQLRQEAGRDSIGYDQRVYELALARVQDTLEYDYFDHTNPQTGSCADNMKSRFGFSSNEYLAENLAGGTSSPISAVDIWMTSLGHRHNLLYDNHVAGAVACESGNCIFLGLNYDGYGQGCYTGEEGKAYQASLGNCSDEQFLQYDQLVKRYDELGKQYERFPKVIGSQSEYQRAMQMYNELQSMYNQIVNFKCS